MGEDSFRIIYPRHSQRQAYRISCPGLRAEMQPDGEFYLIRDLSAGGMALLDKQQRGRELAAGTRHKVSIWFKTRRMAHDIQVEVVRRSGDLIALKFQALSRRQEAFLDKLILELQKKEIAQRKQKNTDRENTSNSQKT
jgi:c-di-GMP-binding flagellar brake protein YcgR